ncbi:MAG: hypothetical protein ACE1ZE_01980, partial [Candidatus Binatia bacterium]
MELSLPLIFLTEATWLGRRIIRGEGKIADYAPGVQIIPNPFLHILRTEASFDREFLFLSK